MKYFLIIYTLQLLSIEFAFSQANVRPVMLGYPQTPNSLSNSSHFKIRIQDQRIDTFVYWSLDGKYPATAVTLSTPTLEALKDFLQSPSLNSADSSSDSLYILIRQLRVPNRNIQFLHEKTVVKRRMYYQLRRYLLFGADVFIKRDDGNFEHILAVNKQYSLNYDSVDVAILRALNEIKLAISLPGKSRNLSKTQQKAFREITGDTVAFKYLHPVAETSLPKLASSNEKSLIYLANARNHGQESGIFQTVDDFKKNTLTPCLIQSTNKDSVFRLLKESCTPIKYPRLPWGYVDSGKLFVRVFSDWYLPVAEKDAHLTFFVPDSHPDLYAILSIEELHRQQVAANTGSGNLLAELGSMAVSGLLNDHDQRSLRRDIEKAGMHQPYRQGYIDLDYGDILFRTY